MYKSPWMAISGVFVLVALLWTLPKLRGWRVTKLLRHGATKFGTATLAD